MKRFIQSMRYRFISPAFEEPLKKLRKLTSQHFQVCPKHWTWGPFLSAACTLKRKLKHKNVEFADFDGASHQLVS